MSTASSVLALLAFATLPASSPVGLREQVTVDARDLYVDADTYVALDWPQAVFPQNPEVTFDGSLPNATPMWRMHFHSAPGLEYKVDCKIYIRNETGADDPKRVQVRAWQRKADNTGDNNMLDAWMKLDNGHLKFTLEPYGDRDVKIWLESRKSWYWTVYGCEIAPRDKS